VDAGQKLHEAKGFGQAVVGAAVSGDYVVDVSGAVHQKKDGRGGACVSQVPAGSWSAARVRGPCVQNDDVGLGRETSPDRVGIGVDVHVVALTAQGARQQPGDIWVVCSQ